MADDKTGAKPSGVVISEKSFRADPGKAMRDACTVPHVVVQGANGQPRMVIVRQREALKLD